MPKTTCDNPMCSCDPCTCDTCTCGVARVGELERRVMTILWEQGRRADRSSGGRCPS